MSRPPRASVPLTEAQLDLFNEHRGMAEQAVRAAQRAVGRAYFSTLEWGDLVSIAALAAMEATVTFDPARGSTYRLWAVSSATRALIDAGRKESARHLKARALIEARMATCFHQVETEELEIGGEAPESPNRKLHGYTHSVVALALKQVAGEEPAATGEDEILEREAAARARQVLAEVMPPVGSEERQILDLIYGRGLPVIEVAAFFGMTAEADYRVFLRRVKGIRDGIRKAMKRRGVTEAPRQLGELWPDAPG